ncbi:MAG: ATP-binding protein [Roseiflexus sp.]|uniref:ATP-binding protein n=1 Tax=Roseiflexus sp. TaxID=2562120 RepID=UPI0025F8EEE7|nr:ATP-binding protein [Roseiflexus sp.]MCL6539510.1 ATP-binding protein [Roseiflexus sp.]
MTKQTSQPIGRGSATERDPNTAEKFKFWIRPGQMVNPFDIVAAEHFPVEGGSEASYTFGLVTNIQHITDAAGHLANFISNDFGEEVDEAPQTPRQGANVAEAAVLSNSADIYMPVQNESRVYFADEDKIHLSLGIDGIPQERRVPAGLIQMSNGTQAVAYLDRHFVLGPEAGHVNISGISGLATKTSYAMFLIQSLLQTGPKHEIAVILLNVKYDDLLRIHEARELSEEERKQWKQLDLKPDPWPSDRVHYFLPWGKNTQVTGRPNSFADPPPPYKAYAYALRETASKLDLLFSDIPDPGGTLSSVIGEIMTGIGGNETAWRAVQTWDDLLTKPPLVQQGIPQKFHNIHPSSVGRFLRLLRRVVKTRQSGVFVPQLSTRMTTIEREIGNIQGGHTYVVDIARLSPEEQTLVFGDVLRTVYGLYSGEALPFDDYEPPSKVIIFVDELNKYAPARGHGEPSPILEQVLDIAERGRSFGMILFSAQQFLSAVHERVTGNSATRVLGRTDSAEINAGNYRFLDQDIRNHLTRLDKGELILSHPIYRQPVKIRFPRPPFQQGRVQK